MPTQELLKYPLGPSAPEIDYVETEDDLGAVDRVALAGSVVFATDWTVETVVHQMRKGTLQLDPIFQRRDAWTSIHKSRFIESLFLGIPIPQLVLAEAPSQRGSFIVIDGKQRLLTLLSFFNENPDHEPLRLRGLRVLTELEGKTLGDIFNDPNLAGLLAQFENQPIRTVVLRNWKDESVLYLIFHRLNSNSVRLSPQELRQAMHPGPFLSYCFKYSETSPGLRRILRLKSPDFRMRDVELLIRYFGFQFFLQDYNGDLKAFLDETCIRLNRSWDISKTKVEQSAHQFEKAVEATYEIFGRVAFRKFNGEVFERSFNRAVFDIMCLTLSDPKVRKAALDMKQAVEAIFIGLCRDNVDFLRALESTTKSKEATARRINTWSETLGHYLGVAVPYRLEV